MSDPETLSVYAAKAKDYAAMTSAEGESPALQRFIAGLPAHARTLDLGCGPGFAAQAMAAAGHEAHAWDPVPEMVTMAQAHEGVAARQAGFSDLTETAAYDGIWANFSMLHTPLAHWPDQFARIARALKPKGLFHFGTKLGNGEKRDSIGRLYSYMNEGDLLDLCTRTGFTVEHTHTGEETGMDGKMAAFIILQGRAHG